MKDANGRPIEVGDVVATPYSYDDPTEIAKAIADAVLGTVVEMFSDNGQPTVHIGDGITYRASEIITLGGLKFVTCECGCRFPWPLDVRMDEKEECPDCGALLYK